MTSMRGKLLCWIGLLLAALLAGIGVAAYQWTGADRLTRIDEALGQRAAALASDLRFEMGWPGGATPGRGVMRMPFWWMRPTGPTSPGGEGTPQPETARTGEPTPTPTPERSTVAGGEE